MESKANALEPDLRSTSKRTSKFRHRVRTGTEKEDIHEHEFANGKSGFASCILHEPEHCNQNAPLRFAEPRSPGTKNVEPKPERVFRKPRQQQISALSNRVDASVERPVRNDRDKSRRLFLGKEHKVSGEHQTEKSKELQVYDFKRMREILNRIPIAKTTERNDAKPKEEHEDITGKREEIAKELFQLVQERKMRQEALEKLQVDTYDQDLRLKVPEEGKLALFEILKKVQENPRAAINFAKSN